MIKSYFQKRILQFQKPAGTSRGIMLNKPVWYIYLYDDKEPKIKGIGECSIIPGLSIDDESLVEDKLSEVCKNINSGVFKFDKTLTDFPGINFGVETAHLDLQAKGSKILFPSSFTQGVEGIKINGLVWMGSIEQMMEQVNDKIDKGFKCIKLKIGAIGFKDELLIIRNIRQRYGSDELQIRVDANGAFTINDVREKLSRLSELNIHSIEQPIMPSQLEEMAELCALSPVDIALDEELIGKYSLENKRKLIEIIKPQYLVLKPGLLGGFRESTDWINIASEFNVGWWVTSALESNIGLNAIAQWTYTLENNNYQGLGTGNLYVENVGSPLVVKGEKLFYDPQQKWNFEFVY
jgi:O-succinylbenzoate synthase